jgi:hypothetical protein
MEGELQADLGGPKLSCCQRSRGTGFCASGDLDGSHQQVARGDFRSYFPHLIGRFLGKRVDFSLERKRKGAPGGRLWVPRTQTPATNGFPGGIAGAGGW